MNTKSEKENQNRPVMVYSFLFLILSDCSERCLNMNNKLKIGLLLLVAALITVSGVAALPSYAPGSTNPAHRTAAAPGCAGSCHNMPVFCAQCHLYPYATPNATATPTATATPNATATPTATATPNATATPTATPVVGVEIKNLAFNPAQINISEGTTVIWTNNDSLAHTVISDTNIFNSSDVSPGQTFEFTFNETGIFKYHCSIHPEMLGG